MASKTEIVKLLAWLGMHYPGYVLTEEVTATYVRLLEDLPIAALEQAAQQHLVTSRFFPAIAELRQPALDLSLPRVPTAQEAWAEVCQALRHANPARREQFDNRLITRAIDCVGGWWYLCNSDNPVADRARFLEAYATLAKALEEDRRLLPSTREYKRQLAIDRAQAEAERLLLPGGDDAPADE